jgi:biopolymer transport protein ExbB/TolQ
LSAIAGTASLIGILNALMDLKKAFPAMFDPPPIYGDGAGGPSEALVPIVMGLFATILALWIHSYLCAQLEKFDTEMRAATLELANSLSLLRQRN